MVVAELVLYGICLDPTVSICLYGGVLCCWKAVFVCLAYRLINPTDLGSLPRK